MAIWRDLSREAHLWYILTSADYIAHAKPKLQEALDFLREGVKQHPFLADYRPVPYWGGVMEDLLNNFDNALAALKAGNFEPMQRWASRLGDVPRGFAESNLGWLSVEDEEKFKSLLNAPYSVCGRFLLSVSMSTRYSSAGYQDGTKDWHVTMPTDVGIMSNDILVYYEDNVYTVIGRPSQIPEYAADTRVTCKTGDIVPWTGVWVPTTGMGTAALAFARQGIQIMQPAYEMEREFTEDEYPEATKLVDTTWHPVKPTGRMVPLPPAGAGQNSASSGTEKGSIGLRCEAGQPCPQEGWWSTPARTNSRQHFKAGDLMPSVGGDYGATIWQWDENQVA